MWRHLNKIFLFLCFFLGLCVNVCGQDISFQASVDRKKAGLDSTIVLDLTVAGVSSVAPMQLPDIDGFKSRYIGPSTSISIVNGQQSSFVSHKYLLYPQKTGMLTIPALMATIEGKEYETQPLEIEILESAPAERRSLEAKDVEQPANLEDKLFLEFEISKEKIYLHERLPITIKLYASNISLRDVQFPALSQKDFVFEDFEKPVQYQDVVGGIAYDVVEFRTAAYPARSGIFTFEPAVLECNIVYKRPSRRSSLFSGFSDDFFGDFFGSYEMYPIAIKSKARMVEVLSLPEGAPQSFGAAVGQFVFQVSASPREVGVGDPITIKMEISGNGNLKNIDFPSYQDSESFKVYDPQIKQQGSAKTLEQVLIPKNENVSQVPAVSFAYFDPDKERYQIIRQGPFDLQVRPVAQEKRLKIFDPGEGKVVAPETFGRDIIFIKQSPGVFYSLALLVDKKMFFLCLGGYIFILVLVIVLYRKRMRIKTDLDYARRLRAPQRARQGLRHAENFLKNDKSKEFYDAVYKVLQKYFSEKFSIPEGLITAHDIKNILQAQHVTAVMVRKVQDLLSACEMIRYGATAAESSAMQKSYQMLKEILDFFERM